MLDMQNQGQNFNIQSALQPQRRISPTGYGFSIVSNSERPRYNGSALYQKKTLAWLKPSDVTGATRCPWTQQHQQEDRAAVSRRVRLDAAPGRRRVPPSQAAARLQPRLHGGPQGAQDGRPRLPRLRAVWGPRCQGHQGSLTLLDYWVLRIPVTQRSQNL